MEAPKQDHFLAMSILIAAVIIGGSFIYSAGLRGGGDDSLAQVRDTVQQAPSYSNATIDDDVILGDPDAPVTIIEFGDYQCPFCKKLYDDTAQQLRDEYIATGKVRKVFRDFPLSNIHPFAQAAAEAAECAGDQESYWLYHDALFARQAELPSMDYVALAGELGLDTHSFGVCYSSGVKAAEVEKDYQDAVAAGAKGTPAMFINGRFVEGALPYQTIKNLIEEALQEAGA